MDCPICRADLPQDAPYCTHCGSLLVKSAKFPLAAVNLDRMEQQSLSPAKNAEVSFLPSSANLDWVEQLHNTSLAANSEVIAPEHQEHKNGGEHEKHEDGGEHEEHEEEEEENERLLVFSDGIIAFALTVAAITIKIPADVEQLTVNRTSIILRVFMYIVAFIIVASAWADHHTLFHYIKRNTVILVTLNFLYLAATIMFPIGLFFLEFGVEISNTNTKVAGLQIVLGGGIFLGSQLIGSLGLLGIWLYAKKGRLFVDGIDSRLISYITRRLLSKPILFVLLLITAGLAFIVPYIAIPVMVAILLGREIYFRRYKRGLDLIERANDTKRIQLFSDAVIGIAITLSIAQIEFPSLGENGKNALEAVNNQLPLLHAFLVGMVIMGIYWLFHYHLFRLINRHDSLLVFLNSCFLLGVTLMLVPISWFANYYNKPELNANLFFGSWQILTSLMLVALWWHAIRKKRLLAEKVTPEQIKQVGILVIANPIVFLTLTIISSFTSGIEPSIYIGMYLVLIGAAWLSSRWLMKRQASVL